MTFPSFSVGEVLRAQDMNAVGMWLVKTVTIGAGVSSVPVTDAFSADYDAYKIIVTGGAGSTATALKLHLGSSNTNNYFGFMAFGSFGGTAVSGINDNDAASFTYAGGFDTNTISANIELLNPFSSTDVTEISSRVRYGTTYGNYVGVFGTTTSFTGFTLTPFSGTLTGGTIRVYGYRN
jgi:hypothetical protein